MDDQFFVIFSPSYGILLESIPHACWSRYGVGNLSRAPVFEEDEAWWMIRNRDYPTDSRTVPVGPLSDPKRLYATVQECMEAGIPDWRTVSSWEEFLRLVRL